MVPERSGGKGKGRFGWEEAVSPFRVFRPETIGGPDNVTVSPIPAGGLVGDCTDDVDAFESTKERNVFKKKEKEKKKINNKVRVEVYIIFCTCELLQELDVIHNPNQNLMLTFLLNLITQSRLLF